MPSSAPAATEAPAPAAANGDGGPQLADYIAEEAPREVAGTPEAESAAAARPARAARPAPAPVNGTAGAPAQETLTGPDGEPLADWEIDLIRAGSTNARRPPAASAPAPPRAATPAAPATADEEGADGEEGDEDQPSDEGRPGESRNARRRRRRRNKGGGGGDAAGEVRFEQRDRPQPRPGEPAETGESVLGEPVSVAGYLDLREEGYGFLRVNGYLPAATTPTSPSSRPASSACARATTSRVCAARRPQREEPGDAGDRHGQRR